jgi:hypothetical protein
VQLGERHHRAGNLHLGVDVDREAPAVVLDPHATVGQQGHLDRIGITCHGLVDGVVHDLLHQVVQATLTGGSDVHAGPFAHRLEALENRQ